MPQLDIDLLDDFLFFAFLSLLFGVGDEESEEGVVEMGTDQYLAHYYLQTRKTLVEQRRLLKHFYVSSILGRLTNRIRFF